MTRYRISNRNSGIVLGIYAGETVAAALDAMARDAGYRDYAAALDVAPGDGLTLEEVQKP